MTNVEKEVVPFNPVENEAGHQSLLTIVIPTKNEAANIVPLLDRLNDSLPPKETAIVFVDDSNDETRNLIKNYPSNIPVVLIERNENKRGGLSTAVLKGMDAANSPYICVMDADLQHPAEVIPIMLKTAMENDSDIVIASRYVPGSFLEDKMPSYRHMLSKFSVKLTWLLFPEVRGICDPVSGFFLAHKRIIENINLTPVGFKILLELLVKTHWNSVIEIPYVLKERHGERSKANAIEGLTFFYHFYLLLKHKF